MVCEITTNRTIQNLPDSPEDYAIFFHVMSFSKNNYISDIEKYIIDMYGLLAQLTNIGVSDLDFRAKFIEVLITRKPA